MRHCDWSDCCPLLDFKHQAYKDGSPLRWPSWVVWLILSGGRGIPCLFKEYLCSVNIYMRLLGQDPKWSMLSQPPRVCLWGLVVKARSHPTGVKMLGRGQTTHVWAPLLSSRSMVAFRKVCWILFVRLSPGEASHQRTGSRYIYMQCFRIVPLQSGQVLRSGRTFSVWKEELLFRLQF